MKILLNQQVLATMLKTPDGIGRIELCDTQLPGLYIEVRATSPGQGTYYLRYKDCTGKTCHSRVGRTTDIELNEARKKAKTLKAEIQLGSDPRGEARKRNEVLTFSEFMHQQYFPYVKSRKRSWKRDEQLFRLRLEPAFGKKG